MARSPSRRTDGASADVRGYGRDRHNDRRRSGSRPRGQRSSGQDRRYDDRERDDGRLREYSRDRYDDRHRGSRRDRSRERKRSRERSPVRERRHDRDRYRDDRDYDDRDRKRARREGASPHRSRREDSRDRARPGSSQGNNVRLPSHHQRAAGKLTEQTPAPTEPKVSAEEERLAKLAKVQAWKKKVEAKRRQDLGLPPELDLSSPGAFSAASPPATSTGPASPAAASVSSPPAPIDASPAAYAGKFDPKAIAKRAAAAMERDRQKKTQSALGSNVIVPKSTSDSSAANKTKLADTSTITAPPLSNGHAKSSTSAKVASIGLNKASAERSQDQSAAVAAAPLDEDDEVKRTFEKLPDMPTPDQGSDAPSPPLAGDQDDAIHSDDEDAEAARAAAMKRAMAEQEKQVEDPDSTTVEVSIAKEDPDEAEADKMEQDDVDPLDAFMSSLEVPTQPVRASVAGKKQGMQVFNSDDEEPDEINPDAMNAADSFALAMKRKKKDIPTINHAKMLYEDFRKNFYTESAELADMTPEEVDEVRQELDNIKCRGKNPPKPILKWAQAGFGAQILDIICSKGFAKPTAIQSQALPAIMSGRDIIGVAKTGSGKTLAFVLPMLRHIKDQRPLSSQDGPIGLILAPTRELILQIYNECKPFLKALNLRAVCVYGGEQIKDQIAQLKSGAEIVIGTAGRTIDLLTANSGRVMNLHRVTYIVLDEADRMYDMGNEPSISKILSNIRPQRQTVLFSATFPKNMEALARKALTQPIEIVVGGKSVVAPEITQSIEVLDEKDKFKRLLELLGQQHDRDPDARTLIFVDKQESADGLHKEVLKKSYPVVSIHGGREQVEREDSLRKFKTGDFPIMIATSVAARGLDIKELKLVVNYDSPNHGEDYVHRCGRTGRAGNTGTAVTFVTPDQDRYAPFLIKALRDSKQDVPEALMKLSETHEAKVKSGVAKKAASGFGGRGIEHLEAQRDAERAAQRKQYRTGDEPEEEEDDKDKKKKDEAKSKVDAVVANATSAVKSRDDAATNVAAPAETTENIIPSALADHLNNAMKVSRAERPAATAQPAANDPLAAAARAAGAINSRIGARGKLPVHSQFHTGPNNLRAGTTRTGVPPDNRGPDAGAFHATLEINDFPQKARWGVTNRTNVAKILESTQTSITSKGIYYAPGNETHKEAGAAPKLYILVEGDTENQVQSAMGQLTKLLREGTEAAMNDESRAPRSGRYTVV